MEKGWADSANFIPPCSSIPSSHTNSAELVLPHALRHMQAEGKGTRRPRSKLWIRHWVKSGRDLQLSVRGLGEGRRGKDRRIDRCAGAGRAKSVWHWVKIKLPQSLDASD
jgi:hypothetical protein